MTRFRHLIVLALLGVLGSSVGLHSEEWTRFHGPNGTGESETVLPATWTEDDYNFRIELPGTGNSSPVLWGDRLFLLSADPKTSTRHAVCYDAFTGQQIWRKDFPSKPHHIHQFSNYASSTPAADEDQVYMTWSAPESLMLVAFSHAGDLVWKKDLGPWMGQHGFGSSPMIFEDLVIVSNTQELPLKERTTGIPPHSFLLAFDRKTGDERWRLARKTDHVTYSVPALFTPSKGITQLVNCSTGSGIYAVDPRTGQELWSTVVFDKRTVSSPIIHGDLIVGSTGSGNGGNYLAAVRSDGKQAEEIYRVEAQAPYVPSVVARGDLLFLISDAGVATCIDLSTGKVHWRERIGGNYQGSPVRAADKIYCASTDGEMVVLAADKTFQELGRIPLGEGSRSTPAIALGRLYVRTFSHLLSLGGDSAKSAAR